MQGKPICILAAVLLSLLAAGQSKKGEIGEAKLPVPRAHFLEEYTFDSTIAPARWLDQSRGLHVSFGSTNQTYFRSEVPDLTVTREWHGTGWRGERLNALILIWSPDSLRQVRITLHDLAGPGGRRISTQQMQANMVRYVVSNYPYNSSDANCYISPYKETYLMPDRFESFDRFDLPARTVRPVWVSIDIPPSAVPGTYTGKVEVQTEHFHADLTIQLRVQNMVLPPPHEWKHRLDLWQNPWVIAWYYHVEPWSEEHKMLLKKHLSLYAQAGGKFITTYAIHSPWSDDSYMIEETMIQWIRTEEGQWKFDYNIFDQYVQLAMEAGIDQAITIYTPVPWENRFRYLDQKTGNYVYESWEPGSKAYHAAWDAFLTDLHAHLEQKGWLGKTYLGINENTLEQTLAAIRVIRQHSNQWKITYAGNWHKELDSLLNDYSFLYGNEPDPQVIKNRTARGSTSSYYICCNPPKPNDFVFSPPVQGRWLGWYTAARHYDGFLRWAFDAWPSDPVRDARHIIWPAGDCFLVYPGANSSVRFEKLREGIVDNEKIRILRTMAAGSSDPTVKTLMADLETHLKTFVNERDFVTERLVEALDKGNRLIADLSDHLSP